MNTQKQKRGSMKLLLIYILFIFIGITNSCTVLVPGGVTANDSMNAANKKDTTNCKLLLLLSPSSPLIPLLGNPDLCKASLLTSLTPVSGSTGSSGPQCSSSSTATNCDFYEKEPNDTGSAASAIPFDTKYLTYTITGTLTDYDYDYFSFKPTVSGTYYAKTTAVNARCYFSNNTRLTAVNQSFIGSSGSANNFYCDSPNTAGAGYAYGYTIIISTPTGTPSITSFTPASGNSGDTVIITGTNFSSTASSNTVKFNGVSATVTQASSTSLTVTVPTGATSGTISVTNGGLTGTSASSFTVGVAVITSFTPTTGRVGTAIKISGSNFDTTSIVKFNGTLSSIFKDYEGYFYANVPSGATTGKISIQNSVNTATSSQSFTVDPSTSNLRIFVSAGTQQGAMSYNSLIGTEAADAFCNADTNRPDLTKTYKALLNKKAIVVLKANTSYYRSNGTTLVATTTTSGNLLPTTLTNSISTTATTVWTGYNGNGDVTADCYGFLWTWYWSYGNSVSTTGITAIANSTSGYLQSGATVNCTNYYNVFCVEQ